MLQLLQKLKGTLKPGIRRWEIRPEELPWFDQPNALPHVKKRLADGELTADEAAHLRKWVNDGYFVVPNSVEHDRIDAMLADLDALWTTTHAVPRLTLGEKSHREIVAMSPDEKENYRAGWRQRIHGFFRHSPAARVVYEHPALKRWATLILEKPAIPHYLINFTFGSQQQLHQDMAVFHILPLNYLVGAWVACEDISPDSGPLIIYPGSHRTPMFEGFTNYPQTNLRTASDEDARVYHEWLDKVAEDYPRETFLAKKGDTLFWHGNLIHGGGPITRPKQTRQSCVIHYVVKGVDRADQMVGPFRW